MEQLKQNDFISDRDVHSEGQVADREEKEHQVLGLGGVEMDLGMMLPHRNISFHATIAYVFYLSRPHCNMSPSVMLPEDVSEFHAALGYNSSE